MKLRALKAAFPHTIPVLTGFAFLGFAYGFYMQSKGFGALYTFIMCTVIFGGSLQFVAAEMLLTPFAPLATFIMALLIQARHIFYGLSMLKKYEGTGLKKIYLIYAMCDETFSINCSANIPFGVDKTYFMFFVTLLNQSYWVIASVLGNVFGSLIKLNTDGIDFVMTAMFVVIFVEQFLKEKSHASSLTGLITSIICLLIFGPNSFLIPTMATIIIILTICKSFLAEETK